VSGRTTAAAGAAVVFLLAGALTLAMARPILRHPADQTVGEEFAGRYRDPFVVMAQYQHGAVPAPFLQPATDLPGILIARRAGGVTAYNILDLLSFPLAALTAYLLAWKLSDSIVASVAAGLMFAWSPFHVAQAAYHLHIAQVQWMPLLLLAIWTFAARPSIGRLAAIAAAWMVLAAASFYWGFVGAILAPIALVTASALAPLATGRSRRRTVLIGSALAVAIAATMAAAVAIVPSWLPGDAAQYAFTRGDQALYAARWASYVRPPAGQVEQQITPGLSVLVLAVAGGWLAFRERGAMRAAATWLLIVAVAAIVCSTDPGAQWLFRLSPFFRAHARFAGVVALCAAICAGLGVDRLWSGRPTRWVAMAMLTLVAIELRPAAARARDVLPAPGYQWLTRQAGWRVLDCTPPGREYAVSVSVLLGDRAAFRQPPFDDCAEPGLAGKLARLQFTHLLVRNGSREGRWLAGGGRLPGLSLAAASEVDRVFAVDTPAAVVYVSGAIGFHDREFAGPATWRWMPREAEWLVTNAAPARIRVSLELHAAAFEGARRLELWIDRARAADTRIEAAGWYRLPAIELPSGETRIMLRVPEGDVVAGAVLHNGDERRLALRIDDWRWNTTR
jgi:hypothetical protein